MPDAGPGVISRMKKKLNVENCYWVGWKQQKAEKEVIDDIIEALARG